jgi:REP element-mobilizing transposase RayT
MVADLHYSPTGLFLGEFPKLRKATISFVTSVHLSVRMEQRRSHLTDFHENRYLNIFRKFVKKVQVSLKSDKSSGNYVHL